MKRRASLAISTNAIVVLIIAVIMLGLLVGLIQRAVGNVENKLFEKLAGEESEPPLASNAQPVTVSSNYKAVKRGESFALKVRYFNPDAVGQQTNVVPGIKCGSSLVCTTSPCPGTGTGPIIGIQANPRTVSAGDQHVYTALMTLSNVAEVGKVTLCQIVMTGGAYGNGNNPANPAPFSEFQLEVRG